MKLHNKREARAYVELHYRAVVCLETKEAYPNIAKASQVVDASYWQIRESVLSGGTKPAGKFHFDFVTRAFGFRW